MLLSFQRFYLEQFLIGKHCAVEVLHRTFKGSQMMDTLTIFFFVVLHRTTGQPKTLKWFWYKTDDKSVHI